MLSPEPNQPDRFRGLNGPSATTIDIDTTRFGRCAVSRDRIITFNHGIHGFPDTRGFFLIEPREDPIFFWLQSVERGNLAFVVTNPDFFIDEYSNSIRPKREDLKRIGLERVQDGLIFAIVNKVDGYLTGNLRGPLIVNGETRQGAATVLHNGTWGIRERLLRA